MTISSELVGGAHGPIAVPTNAPGTSPGPIPASVPTRRRSGRRQTREVRGRGGCGRSRGVRGPVPRPAGGRGLAVEHPEFVVDAVGRCRVQMLRALFLGRGNVAEDPVYRGNLDRKWKTL